ncbi:hypothetical protein EYZ11_011505 [Aspergillus tanneri]|uniref:Trichothecene 3-O-acetyltransferase-like N-terminal domain-containing protein n=1 Tax=Aspergillus tanneri TaxID=1220188 RepID=A0A4S3J4T3_9EURO|nr:uncharacterized protein ATNIH1004_011001 [Aspergillus tanneri]KAA8642061.1 hypothetical protein ATNIH1004_011001 [Aspergillus tanneri]THC89048.1 hypothetical protein EYZ11_011505 [Aspergillus tanneri]
MLENDRLDILGTQPTLHKLYTQICSVYPIPDPSSHGHIVGTLRNGLNRLGESFPWLAGIVINEGASEGVTGTFRIAPTAEIPLVIKDLRTDPSAPTIDSMREAKFPFTMFDESVIAPCMTLNLPGSSIGLVAETGPVFAVQVNFISGGLVLTFVGQHNVMDMAGQASIINWLSKACYNLAFSDEELFIGNMDKSKSVPLLDDSWEPGPELDVQMANLSPKSTSNNTTLLEEAPSISSWRYVEFAAASLQALKSLATQTKDPHCGFISTDDALCAFIWKCTSRARESRLEPGTLSTFARALDARQCLGIPSTYPGTLSNMAYSKSALQDLSQEPLGIIASQLRRQLDPKVRDLAYDTRALATFLNRCADKSKILITAAVDISSGMLLSSWAKVNLYDLDFNLGLGKPDVVRRPRCVPVESLIYIMPKSPNGDLAVALCLRDEDWERLNVDKDWKKYAVYIG